MSESAADLLWHNLNRWIFWIIQQQDGFCRPEIFAKMFLDHFQLVNKLLKCVDCILRTLYCVRGQITNFLFPKFLCHVLRGSINEYPICIYLYLPYMQYSSVTNPQNRQVRQGSASNTCTPKHLP